MEGVIKHGLNKQENGYSAMYQTPQTLELDAKYGLTGEPVKPKELAGKFGPHLGFLSTEEEVAMPFFAIVAAQVGYFVGLPLNEIVENNKGKIGKRDLERCVTEGSLEKFEDDGVDVVAPTTRN